MYTGPEAPSLQAPCHGEYLWEDEAHPNTMLPYFIVLDAVAMSNFPHMNRNEEHNIV